MIKSLALCAIACSVAICGYAQSSGTTMTPQQRATMYLNNLETSLNLTEAQVPQVQALLDSEATAQSANDTLALKGIHAHMSSNMSKILTSAQMAKYNRMMMQKR